MTVRKSATPEFIGAELLVTTEGKITERHGKKYILLTQPQLKQLMAEAGVEPTVVRKTRVVRKPAPVPPTPLELALRKMPTPIRKALREIQNDRIMGWAINELMPRSPELGDQLKAMLIGVGVEPHAKARLDEAMDEHFAKTTMPKTLNEVVVGAGLHAAIYCAVRVAQGFPKPFVVEQSTNVGGAFAVSRKPSFLLNSRNRPGPLSVPGDMEGSLNFLPGALVQPADLSGAEYLTNDLVAYAIRLMLLQNTSGVLTGFKLGNSRSVYRRGARIAFRRVVGGAESYADFYARRMVFATGLGEPVRKAFDSPRLLTAAEFMARMDDPFPFRDLRRVAVIGAGDSGKTVIEALCGQGPSTMLSTSTLDRPAKISWFGVGASATCDCFLKTNRSRYSRIAKLLPTGLAAGRIEPRVPFTRIALGYESVLLDGVPFDMVIDCRGFTPSAFAGRTAGGLEQTVINGRVVGFNAPREELYAVGPSCQLPVEDSLEEDLLTRIGENATSLFRYAGRTAALAAALGA